MKTGTLEEKFTPNSTARLRVLILGHSQHDADLILSELKEAGLYAGYTLVQDRQQFVRALEASEFEAVLSDFRLPGWTGIDAFRELRASGKDIPFLLVTGTLGEEAAVDCIKAGVSDYVLKERLSRLPAALKRAIREKSLHQKKMQAQTELVQSEMRAQEQLRDGEARHKNLIDHSPYGIFRATFDGSFHDTNPALLAMLGFTSVEELRAVNLGRDVFRFPEHWAQLTADCRENGPVHGAESEWQRRDGGLVAVRLGLRRVSIPSQADSIEVIAEDVTELRAIEGQLRQAQKFESIGQLAGGVAHDFNNVVGAILGWAGLGFEQNKSNPQIADRFTRIREQAERAAALTRELLALARRQILQPQAVDLNTVTSSLVSFLDKVIGKDIELKVITSPLEPVKADPTQIEQVLMNLCLNARDAMPGGGRLLIETEMTEIDSSYCRSYPSVTPGRYSVLSVSDTGVGMDAATRERIFEPFFTTKERGKGTGLGLATAYGIVKQHGGFIHVYSELGQGSLFRVCLPALEAELAGGTPAVAPAPLVEMRGSETILIADDHESIREMSRQTLVGLGYHVLSAGDGEEAIRLCQAEAPALAILDVVMPKLGGPATASKLAARFDRLPILFTSGYSRDSENVAPAIADAHYLQKPYSPAMLGRVVREILDQAASSREAHGMPRAHESEKSR